MSCNELSTNISHTSYAPWGKLMAMPQTWHLLRGKNLTAGDIHNGKGWEEFDKESHPKWKSLSKAYPYLETFGKRENKETVHTSVQVSLSTSPPFPVLNCYTLEAKDMHVLWQEAINLSWSSDRAQPLFSLTKGGKEWGFACNIIIPKKAKTEKVRVQLNTWKLEHERIRFMRETSKERVFQDGKRWHCLWARGFPHRQHEMHQRQMLVDFWKVAKSACHRYQGSSCYLNYVSYKGHQKNSNQF